MLLLPPGRSERAHRRSYPPRRSCPRVQQPDSPKPQSRRRKSATSAARRRVDLVWDTFFTKSLLLGPKPSQQPPATAGPKKCPGSLPRCQDSLPAASRQHPGSLPGDLGRLPGSSSSNSSSLDAHDQLSQGLCIGFGSDPFCPPQRRPGTEPHGRDLLAATAFSRPGSWDSSKVKKAAPAV